MHAVPLIGFPPLCLPSKPVRFNPVQHKGCQPEAVIVAADEAAQFVDLATTCTRPDPLGLSEASELMVGVRTAELTNLEG